MEERTALRRIAPALGILPVAVLFVAVAVTAHRAFQADISGDYATHLDYLRFVDVHHWIPRADQGFDMYHPPLYYVVSVVTAHLGSLSLTTAARAVATAAWVLEGVVAALVVRRLAGSWLAVSAAVAVVWLLPGQANLGVRVYMETTVGLGVGLLVLGVVALGCDRRSGLVWLGVGIPVAALSKFSGLLAVIVAMAVVLWTLPAWRRRVLAASAPGLALAGAFYARNVVLFGTPTPLNADLFHLERLGGTYAHYPPGFFTRISLGRCAADHSFYGSAWKWFWATDCGVKPPFRDQVGGWLLGAALVTTVVAVAALVWVVARGRKDRPMLVLAAVPLAILAGFLAYNARVPSGSSGLYLLVAIVPVAAAIGLFVDRLAGARWRLPGYTGVLLWATIMAHASGVAG